MGKTGLPKVDFDHDVCGPVGHGNLARRIKEKYFIRILHLDPGFQSPLWHHH